MKKITIAIVAGEASGDLLGSHLMAALKQVRADIQFVGIGGPKMLGVGMECWYPLEKLAVRGYVEVLKHYREIVGIRKDIRRRWLKNLPDLFIGVDAPDFNLDLELALKQRGVPTVHYISPSIWAWRGERIHKIKRAVDLVLCLFPHEPAIYQAAGVSNAYVGHPLADLLPEQPNREEMRGNMRLPLQAPVFALLPGSRQGEVRALAATFVATARCIQVAHPEARFLVPLVSRETREIFERAIYDGGGQDLNLTLLFGHAQDAMIAADVVLVASGTATLECALLKRPMVITYKMPALSWWLMKRKAYLPYAGLPNILCGRFVVPEILQDEATPDNLAQALLNWLHEHKAAQVLEQTFLQLHHTLRQNTAHKAAEAILPLLPAA